MIQHRCIVTRCMNVVPGPVPFFKCPGYESKVFKKWTVFFHLGGMRKEKICKNHFNENDFMKNIRMKLKYHAVPTQNLPGSDPYVDKSGRKCCVNECRARKTAILFQFPIDKNNSMLQMWKKSLHMKEQDSTTLLRICEYHFKSSDFITVTSFYLKPNAVPRINIRRQIRFPRRRVKDTTELSSTLRDHNYCERWFQSNGNRMCSVYGCNSRAGNNVSLHKFPLKTDERYSIWMRNLKHGKNQQSIQRFAVSILRMLISCQVVRDSRTRLCPNEIYREF
ncbi:uncharacterized protein LOC131691090 [Topomyia yanbarensis]|uniref:uncharacterized protein LOC131691090 n=1 Tax=Topomyia yanbarensis TaxID=2498891 RepID=UPI00273C4360|nr:uncharacterized protein LOC131691090 [Topomyia yanbarensis]